MDVKIDRDALSLPESVTRDLEPKEIKVIWEYLGHLLNGSGRRDARQMGLADSEFGSCIRIEISDLVDMGEIRKFTEKYGPVSDIITTTILELHSQIKKNN